MPLSQAISDTDCIMREYNQLTAAGSYRERMILNRNQYKLNLTPSFTSKARNTWGLGGSESGSRGLATGGRKPRSLPRSSSISALPYGKAGRRMVLGLGCGGC